MLHILCNLTIWSQYGKLEVICIFFIEILIYDFSPEYWLGNFLMQISEVLWKFLSNQMIEKKERRAHFTRQIKDA